MHLPANRRLMIAEHNGNAKERTRTELCSVRVLSRPASGDCYRYRYRTTFFQASDPGFGRYFLMIASAAQKASAPTVPVGLYPAC
jgi:hypothetical protein